MYILEVTGEMARESRDHVSCVIKTHKLGTIKGMFLSAGDGKLVRAEKEYTRKSSAIKMAVRIAYAGYVIIDNSELFYWQRYFPIKSVRVYEDKAPAEDITFMKGAC